MFKRILCAAGTLLGISFPALAGPVTPPAGNYIVNTSTSPTTFPIFSISSGSISQQLRLPYISGTQCIHTVNGKVVGTGSDCGSGGSGSLPPVITYDTTTYILTISTPVITGALWSTGAIRSSSTFITTSDGHLDASALTNPLPYISGSLLYSLNPDSLAGLATNFQAYNVATASETVSSSLVLSGVSESTPLIVQAGNIAFPYGNGLVVSPTASWPSGTHNVIKVFYNGFDDETDFYQAGTQNPNPLMSFRATGSKVGIKTNVPAHDLDVNGDFGAHDITSTYGINGTTGSFTGGMTVNSGSLASTGIYVADGNIAFAYGKAITVSPTASWPSGTHSVLDVGFNGTDDQVNFYTPGALRSTPVISMRSNTGRVGIKQTTPLADLDVNGNGIYTSTGSANTLKITANGTYGTANGSSGGFFMDCTGGGAASGMCGQVYSNAGAQSALDALWYLRADNTAWNEPLLYLSNASSGVQSTIRMDSGWPTVSMIDTSQTSGQSGRKFQYSVHGGTLRLEGRNTLDNAFDSAIIISSMSSYGDVAIGQGYNPAQITQLQVIASTGNTYAFTSSTSAVGGNVVAITTGGAIQVTGGDAVMQLTYGSLIGNVLSSTGSYSVGQFAIFSSTNGQVIGGAGGSGSGSGTINSGTAGSLGYYNVTGSTISQVPGSLVTATSTTLGLTGLPMVVRSTFTMLHNIEADGNALESSAFPGFWDLYYGDAMSGYSILWDVGSQNKRAQCYVRDQGGMICSSGYSGTNLLIDVGGDSKVRSNQSTNQFINLYNGGEMDLQTAAFGSSDIVLLPTGGTEIVRVSTKSVSMVGTANSKYTLRLTTGTAGVLPYQIAFTTMGVVSVSSQAISTPVLTSCGTSPIAIGNSHAFQITGGSAATGCIATFPAGTYKNAPSCSVSQETMSLVNALTYSATNTALTISQTGLGTGKLDIICYGLNE